MSVSGISSKSLMNSGCRQTIRLTSRVSRWPSHASTRTRSSPDGQQPSFMASLRPTTLYQNYAWGPSEGGGAGCGSGGIAFLNPPSRYDEVSASPAVAAPSSTWPDSAITLMESSPSRSSTAADSHSRNWLPRSKAGAAPGASPARERYSPMLTRKVSLRARPRHGCSCGMLASPHSFPRSNYQTSGIDSTSPTPERRSRWSTTAATTTIRCNSPRIASAAIACRLPGGSSSCSTPESSAANSISSSTRFARPTHGGHSRRPASRSHVGRRERTSAGSDIVGAGLPRLSESANGPACAPRLLQTGRASPPKRCNQGAQVRVCAGRCPRIPGRRPDKRPGGGDARRADRVRKCRRGPAHRAPRPLSGPPAPARGGPARCSRSRRR